MKRKTVILLALALFAGFIVLGGVAYAGGKLTLAKTWEGAFAEAKAREVPLILIWPERG